MYGSAPEEHSTHESLNHALVEVAKLIVAERVARTMDNEADYQMAEEWLKGNRHAH